MHLSSRIEKYDKQADFCSVDMIQQEWTLTTMARQEDGTAV